MTRTMRRRNVQLATHTCSLKFSSTLGRPRPTISAALFVAMLHKVRTQTRTTFSLLTLPRTSTKALSILC
eukprot:scaffold2408_cov386-Prasinococcus_capsulatus_cf.AAC.6